MDINKKELNLIRQWYDAVEDLNPAYITQEDKDLANKIKNELGFRTSK